MSETSSTFTQARLDLARAATEAGNLTGLTDIDRAQMKAISGLASLAFHRIPACPAGIDARSIADDLQALWGVVDPLIAVIGDTAINELGVHRFERREFERVLEGALDGNATFVLFNHADGMDEEARELAVDPRGYARAGVL